MGVDVETETEPKTGMSGRRRHSKSREVEEEVGESGTIEGKAESRVLGGYKATLKNPRVSEEAKEHAEQVLEEHHALEGLLAVARIESSSELRATPMSASNTTQILFNSPALHSLKRDQLVKLCKIHSIKASGKNTDLIQKLKQHALTLPRDAPLSIAARSEDTPLPPRVDVDELLDFMAHESHQPSFSTSRPSEQWEVIMESIEELDEGSTSQQGTLNSLGTMGGPKSAGEFGTGGSKSSVSSSIKAFATSLGLKRSGISSSSASSRSIKLSSSTSNLACDKVSRLGVTDDLSKFSTPYSELPPAISVPHSAVIHTTSEDRIDITSDVEMGAPLPGQSLRPGVPAPDNARLSLGLGLTGPHTPSKQAQPTTTIRLISNQRYSDRQIGSVNCTPSTPQLAPFKTSFDLIMSPRISSDFGFGTLSSVNTWSSGASVYPQLPLDECPPMNQPFANDKSTVTTDMDGDITMPGTFSSPNVVNLAVPYNHTTTAPSPSISPNAETLKPCAEPFIFGSPLPKHRVSDAQFREAAANVLEEMNQRLRSEGVESVELDIIRRLHPGARSDSGEQSGSASIGFKGIPQENDIKKMFEKKHQAEFDKMEGIDTLVKRRGVSTLVHESQQAEERLPVGRKRKSNTLEGEARSVPAQLAGRVSGTRVISNGRRSKMIPGAFDDGDLGEEVDIDEERGKKRVKLDDNHRGDTHQNVEKSDADIREELKRKEKEREAIRRRLEVNKARRRSSATNPRLSGRASIGRVNQKPKPTRFGFFSQAKSIVQSVFGRNKTVTNGPSTVAATTASSRAKAEKNSEPEEVTKKAGFASSLKKPTVVPKTTTAGSTSSKATLGTRATDSIGSKGVDQNKISTSRSRSPIPSFNGPPSYTAARAKKASVSSTASVSRNSTSTASNGALARKIQIEGRPSSMGTRTSSANSSSSMVSSLGTKVTGKPPASSRLLAPTASSLAKSSSRSQTASSSKSVLVDAKQVARVATDRKSTALDSITNSSALAPTSPRTTNRIFSQPLDPTAFFQGDPPTARNAIEVPSGPTSLVMSKAPLQRQRTLTGRKPRISRSKVISRLASQRANATRNQSVGNSNRQALGITGKPLLAPGRKRSSLGVRVAKPGGRASHAGGHVSSGENSGLLMSAKKRARQSEYYARRRSRVEVTASNRRS
ncbi:hypothetical protein AX17_001651 [Amanita inopinata Kibby_2008]|nr:hypothetical protein AX17_001651 [Amanita inopinata Kibby_2008]